MAVRNVTMRNALATAYGTNAPYGACFTADPGTADAATNEVTGGAPAYARKALSWGAAAASAITGSATFDIPSGTTVTYFGVCSTNVAAAATVRDSVAVTSQAFASQGTYTVTATYTQS
ncbi:MAG: hypothetical protein IPL80_19905 [Sterolibacteriaceae bacterium]|nr:hypothetical protein [Sterolibacteriaceae bacterium]